ncbi:MULTISPECIES: ABC transporter substrate-binding protein [unclassified Cryobacterium]|uniref:ABC transporter substrate-binding protein n=1 Tax=unclassified Cryobacterium TaxID=2649013 RepID=UPI000CE50538|nr:MULTISPECIES: ABC transporter substrate-binding protein [unclassified Cryobacterium]TFD58311.1 ABC transporter substrate-binding protein [Cryobacterium sp. Hh38]
MQPPKHPTRTAALLAGLLASGLLLSGCAAPTDDSAVGADSAPAIDTLKADVDLAATLPADLRDAGVLHVASGISFPPMEFFDADGTTVVGFDADLGAALGQVLDVDFKFENVNFDGIVGGIAAGRYDLSLTGILDTPSRQAEVDFVDYLQSGVSILVASGNEVGISGPDDLCGHSASVEKGATGDLTIDSLQASCAAAGKAAIDKLPFPDQASAVQAVSSGRADASVALDVTLAYTVQTSNAAFELAGDPFDTLPVGIVVPKDNPELRDAVQGALLHVIESGVYDQILAKWGLEKQALTGAPINSGVE